MSAVSAWLTQFSRTLKTCRLYDARNPAAVHFREELAASLERLLAEHGSILLEFSSREIRHGGHPAHTARSREDNLSIAFYRDGLRTLRLAPGLEPRELDTIVDLVLLATNRASDGGEDLVTRLWDADLPHVDMTYVSAEADTDADGADGADAVAEAFSLPWPGSEAAGDAAPASIAQVVATGASAELTQSETPEAATRSEDWLAGEAPFDLEERLSDLEASAERDRAALQQRLAAEQSGTLHEAGLAIASAVLATRTSEDDRAELARFSERLLREALAAGHWHGAQAALECLHACANGRWDVEPLVAELTHPESLLTASVVRVLDQQGVPEVQEFVAAARGLGDRAAEWLMAVIAASNEQRTRRTLLRSIGQLCGDQPEKLAPWLGDERWYVVRNAVCALAASPAGPPVELLGTVADHPERRVRLEVVNALAQAPAATARPILLKMLDDPDSRVALATLRPLSDRRDPLLARRLLEFVQSPQFVERPEDEARAILLAIGVTGDDGLLPALAEQIQQNRWFQTGASRHCVGVARAIARIGTPSARATLESVAKGWPGVARDACRAALEGMNRG